MRCPDCQNDCTPGSLVCDLCGHAFTPPSKRGTMLDASPAPSPSAKRHTLYEPATPAAPRPSADLFSQPPPPRPPIDPRDPFASSSAPAPAPERQVVPKRSRTIISGVTPAGEHAGQIRGVLVEYRTPADPGRLHALRAGRNRIGRDAECDVLVDDGRVSGIHGSLFIKPDAVTFLDDSRNGSLVDGRAVHGESVVLRDGAVIELGSGGARLVLLLVPPQALGG